MASVTLAEAEAVAPDATYPDTLATSQNPATRMRSLISLRDVAKTYRSTDGLPIHALSAVSLEIAEGEFVSVVGPSGCGKSTLLKIVTGLHAPTSGTIVLDGKPIAGPQGNIGVVFQEATLLPWLTVLRNVLVPADVARMPRKQVEGRALRLLELAGLAGFQNKYPNELSGGMQQRVAICRALLRDPRILLMDEPFGALDALTRDFMSLELQRIWQTQRNTVLFITHSIPEAVLLSDRVIVMSPRPGRILDLVAIDLPRPRTLEMINSSTFGAYTVRVRGLLQNSGTTVDSQEF
jgi:NitT/TauT family transport system ATP-binding protein